MKDIISKLKKEGYPEWYMEKRKEFIGLQSRAKPAKYGSDLDLDRYTKGLASRHKVLKSLEKLAKPDKEKVETVGVRVDEGYRAGTHLQRDDDTIYLSFTDWSKKELFPKYPEGVVVLDTRDAVRKYPWLEDYWFRIIPGKLDKYTSFVGANETGGVFVWIREGVVVDWPIQACFYIGTEDYVQIPHNFIIAEARSKVHLITGCVHAPKCRKAAHIATTEIYVAPGAEVTWSMLHNWKPDFEIRPRIGVVVEEDARYMENYVLLSPVKDIQLYPTVILRGRGARASMRMLAFGREDSRIDMGSAIIFNAPETRGEIMTRAVVRDSAKVWMRGMLSANKQSIGHLECRGLLLSESANAQAYPSLSATVEDAELTHEAAVGKISDRELYYLMSRGLTKEEATSMIARGFLDTDIPGLPAKLQAEISRMVDLTAKELM